MVLDDATVPGYQAGDVRFVRYEDIQTDEMMALTMSGGTIFHNHWLVAEARTIVDRGAALGGSFVTPIESASAPYVIWRQARDQGCDFDAATCFCTSLYSFGDERFYERPASTSTSTRRRRPARTLRGRERRSGAGQDRRRRADGLRLGQPAARPRSSRTSR